VVDRHKLTPAERYAKHREYHQQYEKQRWAQRGKATEAERERQRALARRRLKEKPEIIRAANTIARRNRRLRRPTWFGELDRFVIEEAARLAAERQATTGVKWHIDHILPLCGKAVSGLHVWNNIQVITAVENHRKRNRFPG
jgi:hypothetical protein